MDVVERTSVPGQAGECRTVEAPGQSESKRQAVNFRNQQAGDHDA
ncbi:hypothetical protein [Micromonospora sp. CA-246542]